MFHHARRHITFMNAYWRAIGSRLMGPIALFLVTVTVSGMAATTAAFYWTERGANPGIADPFDALYLAVTTMTGVGYGDVVPITTPGRIVGMLTMLFGTAIFAGFTALFASTIVEVARSAEFRAADRPDRTRAGDSV